MVYNNVCATTKRKPPTTLDHVRTAATAIADALLPTKRRILRRQQSLPPPVSPLPFSSTQRFLPTTLYIGQISPSVYKCSEVSLSWHEVEDEQHSLTCSVSALCRAKYSTVCITRVGHASMLINMFGTTVLTDPVLSERVGINVLGRIIGIDRYTPPALTFQQIPQPDLIVLSHAHFDHTDIPTLQMFSSSYPYAIDVVCARNTADVIEHLPWKAVYELDWGQDISIHTAHQGSITIRALEVAHNGWRYPWERDRSNGYTVSGRSYNAYLLEKAGKRIVFGGDTAWTESFVELRSHGVDVAMMPIGAYQGYESLHCTPEQALAMAEMMNAEVFIPIHFGTFYQTSEEPDEPLKRLYSAAPLYSGTLALTEHTGCYVLTAEIMETR
ncbi:MAG: MBL fold metallo-hydrolase [Bacteroidota bacterium]|nr:MBL fold metallo-hydrolase [Candidatus Kapabacteria bacterium]MDW8219033.1 MBL fold metallo-hydrolase [Bacteroidota bacterium]